MKFQSEKALQDYCLQVLSVKGIAAQAEIWTNSGIRADIVTDDAVIELKKFLNRDAIYQALGQALAYQKDLHRPLLWIVGQLPIDRQQQITARTVAKAVSGNGVRVSFIEEDPFWQINRRVPNFFDALLLKADSPSVSSPVVEAGKLLAVVVSVALVAIVTTTLQRLPRSLTPKLAPSTPQNPPAAPAAASTSTVSSTPSTPTTPLVLIPNWPGVQVQPCRGQNAPANFRSQPSLNREFVIGTLHPGETVYPTGQQVQVEGIVWDEAIAPSLYPRRAGWLAACFLRGP